MNSTSNSAVFCVGFLLSQTLAVLLCSASLGQAVLQNGTVRWKSSMKASHRQSSVAAPENEVRSKRIEQRRRIAELYPDLSRITHAAEKLLISDDSIWSIWLFGSRARGTARPESDWDVALITSSYRNGKRVKLNFVSVLDYGKRDIEVNCLQIPIDIFLRNRLLLPHIAWAVAAEGIPLAERRWHLPIHQGNELFTRDLSEYHRQLHRIMVRINRVTHAYETLADSEHIDIWDAICDFLVKDIQEMAESFLKAGLIQRGYKDFPRIIRSFDRDAISILAKLEDEHFASIVDGLGNARSPDDHIESFTDVEPSRLTEACNRFCELCDALPDELKQHETAFRRENDKDSLDKLKHLAETTKKELSRAIKTLAHLKKPNVPIANLEGHIAARVNCAWDGIRDIRKAMLEAASNIDLS